ncbi:unnamed protein product [Dovyalis caffra]|uniref:protein disulfide-isomerase n=1 Tax=Dovyalis caffra TaxID=77055 RepID=A0AAV1QUK2_9ROSI|nr:unnamed protein product [Dovyalis caffra]
MQNAIFLSELEPTEQQLGWTIEKDVIVILIKGFMGDIQENFTAEVRSWQKQVSIGLSKRLSDLMKEITCLQEELVPLSMSRSSREGKISLKMRGKSSSEGDISNILDDFNGRVGKIDETKQLSIEDSEEDTATHVTKMIKSHETIIRRKSEELKSQKREILKEKGCSYSRRSEKGPVSPRQRFRDVTEKLGNLLHWRANLGETFGYHGVEDHEETSSTKRMCNFDMIEQAKFHEIDASEKVNSISISHDANEELQNEIRKLKMEKEDANLQNVIVEDVYITLLEGLVHECSAELNSYDIAIPVREGISEHILKETINEWDAKIQGDEIEDQITEEMFYLVSREALKDCGSTLDSVLTECREARAESSCLQEHNLEGTLREEIFITFFEEIFKEWNEAIERYDGESIVREDMYQIAFEETIRDMADTANHIGSKFKEIEYPENSVDWFPQGNSFLEYVEHSVKEDVFMVFLKEMSTEWKAEIDSYDFENLIREDIFLLIVMEAMAEAHTISGETEAQDHFKILEDFTSADELHRILEIGKEKHLIQEQDSLPKHENLKCRANPAMKKYNTPPDVVALKQEELNKLQQMRELSTEIDSTSISVCSKVKKALEQVAMSKGLLRELRSSLGVAVEDIESFDDQITPTMPFLSNVQPSRLQPEQNEEVKYDLVDKFNFPLRKFFAVSDRVEEAIHYLNPLVELVALQRREDWLYKKGFIRRCENLRTAETEVDLLGDQVDVLLGLLEKIYRTLHHYSPALQQYFEVSDILKMIEEELNGAVHASGHQNQEFSSGQYRILPCLFTPHNGEVAKALFLLEDKPILHEAMLTTNQDFESLKTFDDKNPRKPTLLDDKGVSKLLVPSIEAILAKVDATAEKMLARKQIIQPMPPTYFRNEKFFFDEKDVVALTQKNFSDFVAANQYVMLNFYAPWCVWSQRLAPEYSAAAAMLKGEAVFAYIDATEGREWKKIFKIKEYPTMYLLINGGAEKVMYDFTDERTSDAIATWVRQKMSLVVQNVSTLEEAERILAARSVLVMGFFDTLEGSDSKELAVVAKEQIDVNFYRTADAEVARLFQIDPQIKRPALVMLKLKWMATNHSHFGFDGQFTGSEISNFISENKLSSVITFTEEDAPSILKNPIKQLWLFASLYPKEVLIPFVEAADHFKGKLLFVHVETAYNCMQSRISYEFGIAEGLPTAFAEKFLEDKLPSQLSSTPDEVLIRLPFRTHNSGPTSTGLPL